MEHREENGRLEQLEKEIRTLMAESKEAYFTEYLQQLFQRLIQQKYQVDLLKDELDRSYALYRQRMQPAAVSGEEGKRETASVIYTSANVLNPPPGPVPGTKRNGEFAVGAVLLSVLGGVFILTSLVMLGMNYMNGFVRGMGLYALAALVIAVSELLLYRKWKMLGSTLSAIGIGGLYLSTVINYLALGNFPAWTAFLLSVLIMAFVIFLSRKRESAMYRILGIAACYICFLPVQAGITGASFLPAAGMIFLTGLMNVFVPAKKYTAAVHIVHMSVNTLFTEIFLWRAVRSGIPEMQCMVFFITSFVMFQLLYVVQVKRQSDKTLGIRVAWCFNAGIYLSMFYFQMENAFFIEDALFSGFSLVSVFVICLLAFVVLRKHSEKWFLYTFFNLTVVAVASFFGPLYEVIFYLALLVCVKLFAVRKPVLLLKINDAVLTALVCLEALFLANSDTSLERLGAGLMFAGILYSIPFVSYWQDYFKLVLTYAAASYLTSIVPSGLKLPVFVGVLFAASMLFHHFRRWQTKNSLVFNALVLSGQIVCFLLLIHPVYRNAYMTYLCMLVFGLGTIILTFQEKYHMNFREKGMITAGFLTYMALVVRLEPPVIKSILLMLIALISVAVGFGERKKSLRIYGLVLSLLICGKMVLYDFAGTASLQKTIVFFAVGVIALVIAGIYIVLEKRNGANEE